jgi:hypothetical protein
MFATWQVGQLFWSMLWFSLFFMLVWVVISVFTDIFRSPDLSGWSKALWTVFVICLPWLGVFLYMLTRGRSMGERRRPDAYSDRTAWDYDALSPAGPPAASPAASPAGDLTALADLRQRGVIDEAEFQAMKQRMLAS